MAGKLCDYGNVCIIYSALLPNGLVYSQNMRWFWSRKFVHPCCSVGSAAIFLLVSTFAPNLCESEVALPSSSFFFFFAIETILNGEKKQFYLAKVKDEVGAYCTRIFC